MCFHQRDHQLIVTSHGEFRPSYNQDSLEVGASSELKSPPTAGELMIKKRELYPQTPAPQSSTHSFKQLACISQSSTNSFRKITYISTIIYYFLQTACNSLTEYGSDFSEDLHDVLHIQAICPSANTWTIPMMILLLLLLWLLY